MRLFWVIIFLGLLGSCNKGQNLHVASPEWRDQIIYFLMTDRFNDGDKNNNDQGANVYDPSKESYYNGGDLQGVIDKLDYIKELGATAVWITPPVANLWYNPAIGHSGYHGYWARNFKAVDEHYGNLETYKTLSHNIHEKDMYLIQDIVINHTGRFFQYEGQYNPKNTAENFSLISGSQPSAAPTQEPFNLIDRNNPDHVVADIYHWTPEVIDYSDPNQEFTYQLSGLNDVNTGNPVVRRTMKDTYHYWIKEVGVDAYRLDSAKYLEHDFLQDFIHAEDGIKNSAAKTGRMAFPVFGEIFETSPPMHDQGELKIASFQGTDDEPQLPSAIAFPLYEEMTRVFAQGRPTSNLTYRLNKQMEAYSDPYIMLNFVDNHDVQRFLKKGSLAAFKQALAMIMTVPGIPVIYQGDEQALLETRQTMFAGGYASKQDHFDTTSEMYLYIKKLTALRTNNKVFSRGSLEILGDNGTGPGALAYKREYEGATALVIFNSADHKTLLSNLATGLQPGQKLSLLSGEDFDNDLQVDETGVLTLELPPRAILILLAGKPMDLVVQENNQIQIDQDIDGHILLETTSISGSVSQADTALQLVIDGNLDRATAIQADHEGRWKTDIIVEDLGQEKHIFQLYASSLGVVSDQQYYQTNVLTPQIDITVSDALGDDLGPNGNYTKPSESSFQSQMDIEQVSIKAGGKNLGLTIKMKEIKSHWLAPNGFDHVVFSIYIDLPEHQGMTDLPLLYAKAPEGFSWDLGHMLFGWGNQLYTTEGAGSLKLGHNLPIAPEFTVDQAARTITINYKGTTLGISSWEDAKIYISTWDSSGGDGHYRQMTPTGGIWEFGGGHTDDPHILDDMTPIRITK